MTLIGEVPPGLAATAARIGDAATVLDEDQVTGFVQEQLAAPPVRRAQRLRAGARRDPDLPAAAAAAARCTARCTGG